MLPDLVDSMKKAALDAVENSKPTALMFGTVTNDDPLEITVEQRLTLTMDQLILTRNVTDFTVPISQGWSTGYALEKHHHTCPEGTTSDVNLAHSHGIIADEVTVHNALEYGESVILIRQEGGQKFVVLDRVVM